MSNTSTDWVWAITIKRNTHFTMEFYVDIIPTLLKCSKISIIDNYIIEYSITEKKTIDFFNTIIILMNKYKNINKQKIVFILTCNNPCPWEKWSIFSWYNAVFSIDFFIKYGQVSIFFSLSPDINKAEQIKWNK